MQPLPMFDDEAKMRWNQAVASDDRLKKLVVLDCSVVRKNCSDANQLKEERRRKK